MADIPTSEELEVLFREGKMERLGMGSRRVCYALPGRELCVKCYRSEEELEMRPGADGAMKVHKLKPAVIREIRKSRFDEKRNTSCQEYRYWKKLRDRVPSEVFGAFPQTMECVFVPSRGWCIVEELVKNFDGTIPGRFSHVYRTVDRCEKKLLLSVLDKFFSIFTVYAVRLYDPQNIIVQWLSVSEFRLRIVDFEPVSRCLIPIDSLFPFLLRRKNVRRMKRWIREHIGVMND